MCRNEIEEAGVERRRDAKRGDDEEIGEREG